MRVTSLLSHQHTAHCSQQSAQQSYVPQHTHSHTHQSLRLSQHHTTKGEIFGKIFLAGQVGGGGDGGGVVSWQERNQFLIVYRCTALVSHLYSPCQLALPVLILPTLLSLSLSLARTLLLLFNINITTHT